MQAGKNAAASVKESAANMAASAKGGMDKTKATVEEKGERMTTHDPLQKDMATEKKEERKNQAELNKEAAREHHAAARQATAEPGTGGSTAVPGLGTDQVTEGVVESHPIGTATGTGKTTTAHKTRVGGGTTTGHGTGGGYSG